MWKEGVTNIANSEGETDEQIWRRLKRIAIVVFDNL